MSPKGKEGPGRGRARPRPHGGAAALLGHASEAGADEALRSLINQFADPLSFLRELVQNSLDAGSTRIEVDFAHTAPPEGAGMATVTVADNGEGMNELVIDKYLLTLFASSKERDLTKIGKFGIGFVSIFAITPDLVVLETGQAGEAWRVVFHADAHYEKLRLAEPIEGTVVRLHKQMTAAELDELRARGREVVRYWCKFAEAEIVVDGDGIGEPFELAVPLAVRHEEPGTELVVGFTPLPPRPGELSPASAAEADAEPTVLVEGWFEDPRRPPSAGLTRPAPFYGYYNRGLTLVESPQLPGEDSFFEGLSFRLKSRYLEHTLTRDNVIQDEGYLTVIRLVRQQVKRLLRPRLVEHLRRCAEHLCGRGDDPGPPSFDAALRFATLPSMALHENAKSERFIPVWEGQPVSIERVRQRTFNGRAMCAGASSRVTELLAKQRVPVVRRHAALLELLKRAGLEVRELNKHVYSAVPVPDAGAAAPQLLGQVRELLDEAGCRVERVALGDLNYAEGLASGWLFVRQEEAHGLSLLAQAQPKLLGGARDVVLNVGHPLTRACLELARTDGALAALLLAQGVIALEGGQAARAVRLAVRTIEAGAKPEAAP